MSSEKGVTGWLCPNQQFLQGCAVSEIPAEFLPSASPVRLPSWWTVKKLLYYDAKKNCPLGNSELCQLWTLQTTAGAELQRHPLNRGGSVPDGTAGEQCNRCFYWCIYRGLCSCNLCKWIQQFVIDSAVFRSPDKQKGFSVGWRQW